MTEHTPLTIALVSRMEDAAKREQLARIADGQLELMDFADDRDGLAARGEAVQVVYGNVRDHEIDHLPNLRWVHATWTGVENLLSTRLAEREVIITNTRGQVAEPMAEHGLAGVLYLARDMPAHVAASAAGQWRVDTSPILVESATAIVLGVGAIGRALTPKLKALGMRVVGVNRDGRPAEACDLTCTLDQVHDHLPDCDFLICLLPATGETRRIVDRAMLEQLKPGAGVINLSRGSVLDQQALLEQINAGRLRGAVLDVTDPEPLPPDGAMWGHPRIMITGHRSWKPAHPRHQNLAFETFATNLEHFLADRFDQMISRVDPQKGY